MKGIKKTLATGALVCATLHAQHAHAEVSPWSYGIKLGPVACGHYSLSDSAKFTGKKEMNMKTSLLQFQSPYLYAGAFVEYAFTDYVGIEVGLGYMNLGGVLKGDEGDKDKKNDNGNDSGDEQTSVTKDSNSKGTNNKDKDKGEEAPLIRIISHSMVMPVSLCIYPMGREEGEGIFRILTGPIFAISLNSDVRHKPEGKKAEEKSVKGADKKLAKWDIGWQARFSYEFAFGLSVELGGGFFFMNRIKEEIKEEQPKDGGDVLFKNVQGLKEVKSNYWGLNVGYNFASLFKA